MITIQNLSYFDNLPSETQLQNWVSVVLDFEEAQGDITVRFADVSEIQQLNAQYRNKDKATNVLSFPSEIPEEFEQNYLGDIIICPFVIQKEAQAQAKKPIDHYAHMLVHGTLHLLGYDHIDAAEAEQMEAIEIAILGQLGIADPYGDSHD